MACRSCGSESEEMDSCVACKDECCIKCLYLQWNEYYCLSCKDENYDYSEEAEF